MTEKPQRFYEFEEFRLDAQNPSLWRGGELVSISPKALETLLVLVGKKGDIVSREELLETVWKDTFVEEGNINYTISLLRKTLGRKEFIQTVPRRGYRFTATLHEVNTNGHAVAAITDESNPAVVVAENIRPPIKTRPRWILLTLLSLCVLFLTSFIFWLRPDAKKAPLSERRITSIAVLPLKNLIPRESDDTLSLGLTDALISRLGSLNRFVVRPLDAVEDFPLSKDEALKFGAELKVDAILAGTFQQAGDRLRIKLRLLDVRDGTQLWAGNFDGTERDVFALQDRISAQVATSLVSQLSTQEQQLLGKRYTDNPEAYRAYMRGRAIFHSKNPDRFEKTIDEYQKAIALDPTFALVYAGFADAFARQGKSLTGERAAAFYVRAKAAARKALELDPQLAEAYASLAFIERTHDWDWDNAERNFKHAIELNPSYAYAHLWYAQMLAFLGRGDEALSEAERALEIDPLSKEIQASKFAILESRGEFALALAQAREVTKFDKESLMARRALATFLFHQGEYLQVIEIGEQELTKNNNQKFAWLSLVATAYQRTGQTEKASERLRQLEALAETETKALYSLAMNYTELGRNEDALLALKKCFEQREERMVWIKVEPRLAHLRSDKRFQELLQRMNLG